MKQVAGIRRSGGQALVDRRQQTGQQFHPGHDDALGLRGDAPEVIGAFGIRCDDEEVNPLSSGLLNGFMGIGDRIIQIAVFQIIGVAVCQNHRTDESRFR